MQVAVKKKKKCEVMNNCLFCYYHKQEVVDSDFGGYGGKETCSEGKDCDKDGELDDAFDYESEKDCCDFEFWKVLDSDERMQKLFARDMTNDIDLNKKQGDWESYKYFVRNYE